MRPLSLALLAFLALSSEAAVYRWVDTDGRVHFSDRRQPDAERLNIHAEPSPSAPDPQPGPNDSLLGPYTSFAIANPAADADLVQDHTNLPVSLIIAPPVIEGHTLEVLVDSTPIPVTKGATQFQLSGASFGSHRIQARIRNSLGQVIAQSPPHPFVIRKPPQPGELR